ncbi:MAG: hypothetical protein ACRDGE_08775 [Candidatus Limnocylindria bacterium]
MRRLLAFGLVALLLFALGIAIGRRSGSPATEAAPPATVTVAAGGVETSGESGDTVPPPGGRSSGYARTREGAVAAAADYLAALNGRVILDPAVVRRTLAAISAADAQEGLARAYAAAATQLRQQLGVGTVPEPVVVVRAAPVGYRVAGFARDAATVSIWRVGVVGSGATVEPQQSWRTETVALVWEGGTWKIASLRSAPGPTPPLAGAPTPPAQLFASVPEFEEFGREP